MGDVMEGQYSLERGLVQSSATTMILGSILFLIAAFLPISFHVFPEPSPTKKIESISSDPGQWLAAQVLFSLGAVVTVIGIVLYAYGVRQGSAAWIAWVSVVLLAIGAVPWVWHVWARAADPESFAAGTLPTWPYLLYFLLTELGLAAFGTALLSSPVASWLGWLIIVTMAVLAVLTLVFRDMVPLAFYAVTLLAGATLLWPNP
jgi:hypothetical protein